MTQSSDGLWHNNQTQAFPAQNPWMTTTKGIYIGIFASALVLLAVFVVMLIKKYFYIKKKMQPLSMVSFNTPQTGAPQTANKVRVRAEDNIYIIEDNLYVME